jgi:hypothetical protein
MSKYHLPPKTSKYLNILSQLKPPLINIICNATPVNVPIKGKSLT